MDDRGGVLWQVDITHFATARHQRLLRWVGEELSLVQGFCASGAPSQLAQSGAETIA